MTEAAPRKNCGRQEEVSDGVRLADRGGEQRGRTLIAWNDVTLGTTAKMLPKERSQFVVSSVGKDERGRTAREWPRSRRRGEAAASSSRGRPGDR